MITAAPCTALATIQPVFTGAERLALAGFLAGYRGLTRDAYALDLRQFTTRCRARSLNLFSVRRADIEGFTRDLESRGRAQATVTRRLCTIAGFSEDCRVTPTSWLIVLLLILFGCEQGREDHRADATFTAKRPLR